MWRWCVAFAALMLAACQSVETVPGFSAEQVAVLEGNGFEKVGDHWELGLSDRLLFPSDQSRLGEAQAETIERLTLALTGVGVRGARVVGHADSTGSESHNDKLSMDRAEAVRAVMIRSGMDAGAVKAEGMGARQPIESNDTLEGRQENRRVVVIVTSFHVS